MGIQSSSMSIAKNEEIENQVPWPVADAPDSAGVISGWKKRAVAELARLNDERWADKMKTTIVALVDAHLAGISEETVWGRPETCSRKTYHEKWKKQSLFAEVLAEVNGLARDWKDNESVYALEDAARALKLATPDAVKRLVAIMAQAEDLTNSRLAAVAVLDRAGLETAAKSSSSVDVDVSKLSDEELQRIVAG